MTQSDELVAIAADRYELGVRDADEPYAVSRLGPRVATMIRGKRLSLRPELASAYYDLHSRAPSSNALADAMNVIEGRCRAADPQPLYLRSARIGSDIIVDLARSGDTTGNPFVWVRADGTWQLTPISPVLFRRSNLTGPMVTPIAGGSLAGLRRYVNLSESRFRLFVAWLVSALIEDIPRPVLVIGGPQGTGKSTLARIAASLIDPSPAPLWSPPRTQTDFAVAAYQSYCVGFDNLSGLPDWLSDALCRAVTGDGHVRRTLYSDGDVSVSHYRRAVILNGIDPGVVRGDLVDRSLFLELDAISSERRLLDRSIQKVIHRDNAGILGALLDVTAKTLMTLGSVRVENPPRMADFVHVLAAIDEVMGWSTYDTYVGKLSDALTDSIDSDQVASAVVALMGSRESWSGTASQLLAEIASSPTPRDWPTTATALSTRITRAGPALERAGFDISRERSSGTRTIRIKKVTNGASAPSLPSSHREEPAALNQAIADVKELFPNCEEIG